MKEGSTSFLIDIDWFRYFLGIFYTIVGPTLTRSCGRFYMLIAANLSASENHKRVWSSLDTYTLAGFLRQSWRFCTPLSLPGYIQVIYRVHIRHLRRVM